jgi:hypothetical protein
MKLSRRYSLADHEKFALYFEGTMEMSEEKQFYINVNYYYYYYYYHHHYRISHFSAVAGKYSPILGYNNEQD